MTNPSLSLALSLSIYPSICFNLLLQNMWIERTTYSTAYKLPGILRWFEVKSVSLVSREESGSQSGKQPEDSLRSALIDVVSPLKPFRRWWSE